MNTETVLSNDRIVEIARKLRWQTQYSEIQDNAIELAGAIEQAVLQSERVQAWKRDAARYRATRAGLVGVDPDYGNRFCAYCDAAGIKQRDSITEDQFDAATDAAMEKQP